MGEFIRAASREITESKAIILLIWFLAGLGVFEIARSFTAVALIERNHQAIHRVAEEVEERTNDRWTKQDMLELCERFNERNPDCPVPLEGLK
jgi:hypothetical protein